VTGRYDDRLDPAHYASDEPVGAGPPSADYTGWVWIPERLFHRMQQLASGYELHILPGLDPYERNVLNRERTGTLIEELEFLARVVNDSALSKQIDVLRGAALPSARSPLNSAEFVIEGP